MTFNNMWECKPNTPKKTPVISDYISSYVTLRPLAKDEKGNILNETRFDIQVEESKTKLSEYVESFKEECDIYKILERCARSGDYSILLDNDKPYGDTTPFKPDRPDNDTTLSNLQNGSQTISDDVKEALFSGKTDEEILEIIKAQYGVATATPQNNDESGDNNA